MPFGFTQQPAKTIMPQEHQPKDSLYFLEKFVVESSREIQGMLQSIIDENEAFLEEFDTEPEVREKIVRENRDKPLTILRIEV